jgi:hypothetical protein
LISADDSWCHYWLMPADTLITRWCCRHAYSCAD